MMNSIAGNPDFNFMEEENDFNHGLDEMDTDYKNVDCFEED